MTPLKTTSLKCESPPGCNGTAILRKGVPTCQVYRILGRTCARTLNSSKMVWKLSSVRILPLRSGSLTSALGGHVDSTAARITASMTTWMPPCATSHALLDATRPAFTNATAEEHAAAMRTLDEITAHLDAEGWEAPVLVGSSGSGAMALWRIDLPRDEAEHIQRALAALAHLFTNDAVSTDAGVGNPARIARVPGTVNAKAPTPPDRPLTLATARPVSVP